MPLSYETMKLKEFCTNFEKLKIKIKTNENKK